MGGGGRELVDTDGVTVAVRTGGGLCGGRGGLDGIGRLAIEYYSQR